MKQYLLYVWVLLFAANTASAQDWVNTRTLPPGTATTQPALSYDGRFVYWAFSGGVIYSSTNWGVAWETNTIAMVTNITSLVCSTNGTRLAAATDNGIYYSGNNGKDWLKTAAGAR